MPESKKPTIELHRHWEAGMHPETIAQIAARNGITQFKGFTGEVIEGVDPQDPDSLADYCNRIATGFKGEQGFVNFLHAFRAFSSIFVKPEDIEFAIFEQLRLEQAAGSIHSELRGSPMSLESRMPEVPLIEIMRAMRHGVKRAWEELGMSGTAIMCFSTTKGINGTPGTEGYDRFKDQARYVVAGILQDFDADEPVGLDIAGDRKAEFPPRIYKDTFAPAIEAGVPITVHVGEEVHGDDKRDEPTDFIRQAIEDLGASRIGHGIAMADDEAIKRLVRERGIGVEVSPVSNDLMGFSTVAGSPLRRFLDEGIRASLATDDPILFGTPSVRHILENHGEVLGLTPAHIEKLTRNALETAFVTEDRRRWLASKLEN